jgi:hypothetical protein
VAFNLKGIREAVFAQGDWAPSQSTVAKDRVNEWINRAYMQVAQDAPFLFFDDEIRWAVHDDKVPTLSTDTLTAASVGDAWVLETNLAVGTTDALVWESDRSWAGRALLLTVPNTSPEELELIRIREVWTSGGNIRVSLERPWRNITDTSIEYRVVSDEFTFPDDLIELKQASLFEDSSTYPRPLNVVGQANAEFSAYPHNSDFSSGGVPRAMYRREFQSLAAPTQAPKVATVDGTWVGPEPTGQFEYLFTYVWGQQEVWSHGPGPETQTTLTPQSERYEPYWESPPSEFAAEVDNTAGAGLNRPIQLTLPNIDFTLGFGDAGTARYGRSGVRKRIYRRRKGTSDNTIEAPNTFFLLDEVDGLTTAYNDDGSVTPDYRRPLREVHGYQTFRLYPRPSRRYRLVLRATRRPRPLSDDADTPVLTRDGVEVLIERTMMYLYESQGNAAMADRSERKYLDALGRLRKRYGDLRPANKPRRRPVARNHRRFIRDRDLSGIVDDAT